MMLPRKAVPLWQLTFLTIAYFVAGKLGLMLAFVHASARAVWPPTGIAFAAFLLLGSRVWPAILLGAFIVNVTTEASVAGSIGSSRRVTAPFTQPSAKAQDALEEAPGLHPGEGVL